MTRFETEYISSTTATTNSPWWCQCKWNPYDPIQWQYYPYSTKEAYDKAHGNISTTKPNNPIEVPTSDNPCEIDDFLKNFKII